MGITCRPVIHSFQPNASNFRFDPLHTTLTSRWDPFYSASWWKAMNWPGLIRTHGSILEFLLSVLTIDLQCTYIKGTAAQKQQYILQGLRCQPHDGCRQMTALIHQTNECINASWTQPPGLFNLCIPAACIPVLIVLPSSQSAAAMSSLLSCLLGCPCRRVCLGSRPQPAGSAYVVLSWVSPQLPGPWLREMECWRLPSLDRAHSFPYRDHDLVLLKGQQ